MASRPRPLLPSPGRGRSAIAGRLRWPALWLSLLLLAWWPPAVAASVSVDAVAENMLLLQTASGGWSKHYRGKAVDYRHVFDAAERAALRAPDRVDDATIDNKATTHEIAYLAEAYARTGNPAYLHAARRGVDYLLAAQYANGGWPQYYPDRALYRHQVTFNDDAMTRVLELLQDIAEAKGGLAALTPEYDARARQALQRGLDCVLAMQVRIDDRATIWAAQYDEASLQPARARAYELPSLAVSESVGVLRLLMRQQQPSSQAIAAIEAGLQWLEAHAQADLAVQRIDAPEQPSGKDVVLVAAPGKRLWARFHDLQHQRPLFANRDGEPAARLADVSNERRVGYAWYGTWPERLLAKEWPAWAQRHGRALPSSFQETTRRDCPAARRNRTAGEEDGCAE